ncbi:hypothetical protein CR513_49922, partial [Mucuna pruriens]
MRLLSSTTPTNPVDKTKGKAHRMKLQLRRMKPEMVLKNKEEWNAGFLAVAEYPQWVANIVSIPKKDGKVQMFIDYRDLNRARN